MLATTYLATLKPWLLIFLQADGGLRGTPLLIVIILVLLVLVLFWWGLTRNRIPDETTDHVGEAHTDALRDRAHDHGHDHAPVYDDTDLGEMPELQPADLSVGRVPDLQVMTAPLDTTPARMDELDVEQPIDFEEVALEATGNVPPGDIAEVDLPDTRIAPVAIDMTGNIPPVLEDQGELLPTDLGVVEDDLKIIEGIGPHIARVLAGRGITTFAQLAATDVERLEQIMREEKLRIANPESWPRQAELAASGRWDELRLMQGELKGGRVV